MSVVEQSTPQEMGNSDLPDHGLGYNVLGFIEAQEKGKTVEFLKGWLDEQKQKAPVNGTGYLSTEREALMYWLDKSDRDPSRQD